MKYTVQRVDGLWKSGCHETGLEAIGRCAESSLKNLLSAKRMYDLFEFGQHHADDTWIATN